MSEGSLTVEQLERELVETRERLAELERREAECWEEREALSRAGQRSTDILERITDAFFAVDRQWRFTYVNRQAEGVLRRGRDELLGRNIWEALPQTIGSTLDRQLQRAVAEQAPMIFPAFHAPHGAWYEVRAYPSPEGLSVYILDVTLRRRAEEELRQSEERFRLVAISSPDFVYYQDRSLRYVWIVKSGPRFPPEKVLGRTDWDLFKEEDAARLTELKTRALETGTNVRAEVPLTLDGEEGYVEFVLEPSRDPEGVVAGLLVYARDITERKRVELALRQAKEELEIRVAERTADLRTANERMKRALGRQIDAEQALRQSEARFRDLVELTSDLVWEVDAEGMYTYVSPRVREFLGYEPAEVLGKTPVDLLPPEDRPGFEALFREIRDRRLPVRFLENRNLRKDGRLIELETSASPFYDRQGELAGYRGIDRDIGERKRAEAERERLAEAARRRAAELRGIIDSMIDAVVVIDAEGRVTVANEAAIRLSGLGSMEELQRNQANLIDLLHVRRGDGRPMVPRELPFARALRGEAVRQDELVARDPHTQGDVYLRTSTAPVRSAEGRIVGAVGVLRDVTEMAELDRLKDEFVGVAAHELKTPVTVMKGYAQVLLRTEGIPPQVRGMLRAIDRGADRITRIINDLLDISRMRVGQLQVGVERIDLPQLVSEVTGRMGQTTARHRLRVVRAEPAVVRGDRERLAQVLANLLDNAIRYSPAGGDIDLALEIRNHREAVVSVRDHGVGIPREKQAGIFGRFYRAHVGTPHDYGGMGVGLYIAREIIQCHGGRMWFESEEGVGSTFHFSLPLAQ